MGGALCSIEPMPRGERGDINTEDEDALFRIYFVRVDDEIEVVNGVASKVRSRSAPKISRISATSSTLASTTFSGVDVNDASRKGMDNAHRRSRTRKVTRTRNATRTRKVPRPLWVAPAHPERTGAALDSSKANAPPWYFSAARPRGRSGETTAP